MGLSFEESLKKNEENNLMMMKTRAVPMMAMALSAEDYWQNHSDYKQYSFFTDDDISTITKDKYVVINEKQVNITQEENSQYIPFEMPRYYDGYDLVQAVISIHYDTSAGYHGVSEPVNVKYNDDKIRFAWLVDAGATQSAGKLKFEIHAIGVITDNNGNSSGYVWKTRCNEDMRVLQSLCGVNCDGAINIDDSWVQELVKSVTENFAEQIAGVQVAEQVAAAERAATEAQQSATEASQSAQNAANAASNAISSALDGYATEEYVAEKIKEVDVSEQLAAYAKTKYVDEQVNLINTNLSINYRTASDTDQKVAATLENYVTKEDVADAISSADLDSYYKKTETYSQSEIDEKLENVSVDLTGYATETYVDNKDSAIKSSVDANATNISNLSKTVGTLQEAVNSIDVSPNTTYDIDNDPNNPDVGENGLVLYEIIKEGTPEEEKSVKKRLQLQAGGGGGSATASSLKVAYITTSPLVVTIDDTAIIKYNFSGTDPSGDKVTEGVAVWKVGSNVIATTTAIEGENEFDVTKYLSVGSQKINLTVTDDNNGFATKTWTVQKIDVRLESTFNDKISYPIGTVSFDYTPYGAISKNVYFKLDGAEIGQITTASSGIPMSYEIPAQTHGAHLFEVYIGTEINGNHIESNHILKDIIWRDESSNVAMIGTVYQNFSTRQYDTTNIEYTVIDPLTETPTVTIAVDGNVVSTQTLTSPTAVYQYKPATDGTHVITITCRESVKTLTANVEKVDINIEPVTAGLAFDFNPVGKSNADSDRIWSDGTVSMTASDNFDWVNGGYQIDSNGDQYFCIKAGTSAEIDYKLFADDAKRNGKEFKLVYKVVNVAKSDARFLHCIDNTTETNHVGIEMFIRNTHVYGGATEYLKLHTTEKRLIELEFNINKNTEDITEIVGYENGIPTEHLVYDESYNFTQSTPKNISLGSNDCDLHIYRFKVYNLSLTNKNVLTNFIADARNADELIARYNRNQIYNENGALTAEFLADKCKQLRILKVEAPYFTNKKSDKVNDTTFTYIYKNGDPVLDNWVATGSVHSGQGTSSDDYGGAARNLDVIMQPYKDYGNMPVITLGNGEVVDKISMTRDSIPVNYLNAKVNVASSNMFTNAIMAKRFNKYNPHKRHFVREEGFDTSMIRDTMDYYPCVIFIKESNMDVNTHREYADTDWHFYSMGNIGDSKKNDKTRLTDPDDPNECIVEIMDVELPLSDFPKGDEAIATLEADKFDESGTYGWRYIWEDGTDEENAQAAENCKQKWIEFYKFIVNSTDEEFKSHLGDYMVLDSAIYYYLFTTRYTLVDNRAKNSFYHYSWTGEYDTSGEKIYKWSLSLAYDMDTACGLNNYGDLVYRYGYEDTDVLDGTTEEVFRESDSTFFCRLRDLFVDEAKEMYNNLESQGAWSSTTLIKEIEEWQDMFPEALWIEHIKRLYIDSYTSTFINGAGDQQFLRNMAHGQCRSAVIDYDINQEAYMASKFQSSFAASDNSTLRCTVPTGDLVVAPNYKLKLTPYSNMYLNVKYGTQPPIQIRCTKAGKEYEIPFEGTSADIINIYSSSMIQSFGDLSSFYAATIDTSKAERIKELIIGNSTEGYDNPYLTTLTTGANYLLEKLNVENVSGLTQSLNLSALNNLKELYAHGTNAGGVTFANGGLIEIAELPEINSMTIKNLMYLTTLDIVSFEKLTTLTVENCNTVDILTILNNSPNLNRVRIIGIDWNLDSTDLLERIYKMSGIDRNDYNTDRSVLSGTVRVPVIGQQELYKYQKAWTDLTIIPSTITQQFKVEFQNDDGTVLDTQYVAIGKDAIDPITREENPIDVPTKESTIENNFAYSGWDSPLTAVFADRVIKATYTATLREYTARYISKGTVLQETSGLYGDNIQYVGETPTYTLEESAYKYYLFNRWDNSGFLTGDKVINAIFDSFQYTEGYFADKELSDLTSVEIYALTKLGLDNVQHQIEDGDAYAFSLGYDVDYDDIDSEVVINEKTVFNGNTYVDTGIKLFDVDKDFVLAIDLKVDDTNKLNNVIAQCFQSNGANGFKIWYNSGAKLTWGTSTADVTGISKREMVVIRHKKGDNNLIVYSSNLDGVESATVTLARNKITVADSTLVFGCSKADDGAFENYASGTVYWCKVWYQDLGESACEKLVSWTHEEISMEVYGFKRYYLAENASKRCSFSLLATHLLDRSRPFSSGSTNAGGWEKSSLNTFLNTRLYNAMSDQLKSLVKQVTISSSAGNLSKEITTSPCYISIPSLIEVTNDNPANEEPYIYEGTTISYMISPEVRRRAYIDGNYDSYWLRSPNAAYASYVYQVDENGSPYGFTSPGYNNGVLIEISF